MTATEKDFDEYRQPWETDHAWKIRSSFLRRNWDKVPRDRLFCLSNVFMNMEQHGCCYSAAVMDEVREMAGDLIEAYHNPIKAMVQKTLVRSKQSESTSEIPSKRRRVGSDVDINRNTHNANYAGSHRENIDVDRKRVEDLFCRLRAQLSVAAKQDNPIRRFNELCNLEKCLWRTELTTNECTLLIDDVIVLTQLHWGDPLQAKMNACDTACEILQRASHRFYRTREVTVGCAKFILHSGVEAAAPHQEPSAWHLTGLSRSLLSLSKRFQGMSVARWRSKPYAVLTEACKELCIPFEINQKRLIGWSEQYAMTLAGVVVCDIEVRAVPKNKPHSPPEDELCLRTVDRLLDFNRKYTLREVDKGIVRMVSM
uniref:XRN2-binding (XTBD) domain-containing protein n=1 Tax=Trichuris muris TaxID=70415 RepID=A0A5S6QXB2_TRIMR